MPHPLESRKWIPKWLQRFTSHVGRRGSTLLFFGSVSVITGIGWLVTPPQDTTNFALLLDLVDLRFLAVMWLLSGAVMTVGAFQKCWEPIAFGMSAAISAIYCIAALLLYLPGAPPAGQTTPREAVTYLFYSIFMLIIAGWPEREEIVVVVVNEGQDADRPDASDSSADWKPLGGSGIPEFDEHTEADKRSARPNC